MLLLFINSAISFYEERNAGFGDVVPADCRLTESVNVSMLSRVNRCPKARSSVIIVSRKYPPFLTWINASSSDLG